MEENLYEILGVKSDAESGEIRDAYRELVKKYHPDANSENPFSQEQFKKIQAAYEILGDEEKRKNYDQKESVRKNVVFPVNISEVSKDIRRENFCEENSAEKMYPLPENYSLDSNPDLKKAYTLLCQGQPCVLLTGGAGTGKSTFINFIRRNLKRDAQKNCVVLSPTGVSALNILGQTIHSFFHFPPHDFDDSKIKIKNPLVDKIDLLIIDEISQVESAMLDHIDYALRKWRMRPEPFGGIQTLLTGDPFQLSPWIKYGSKKEKFLNAKKLKSQFFFDAHVFENLDVVPINLTHIYRQQDRDFIDILNTIRTAEDEEAKNLAVSQINKICFSEGDFEISSESLFLTTTNERADGYNDKMLSALIKNGAAPVTYRAIIKNMKKEDAEGVPAPEELLLCKGAKVMVTRNIYGAGGKIKIANGTTGTVLEMRENSVVIKTKDGEEELFRQTWEVFSYVWDDKKNTISTETTGHFSQIPLRPGWAITVHKSQGMTLDSVVLEVAESFAPGQVYVALSRCKTLEGIRLKTPLNPATVFADKTVQSFFRVLSKMM